MDVSIIIVSYNTKDFLRNCLSSIEENVSKKVTYEVIVVDNASTDGTIDAISNFQFPISNFQFIKNKENLGFSKANNIGVKKAKGKYILFLNSDTLMKKDTLETMITFMEEHKDAGAATCKVLMPNGLIDDAAHRGFPTPWNALSHFSGLSKIFPKTKLFGSYNLTFMDFNKTHEIDAAAGAFLFVRREAGEQIGWWDEDYFFYGEDLDFCYMLKQNGWKIYFVPTVSILHYKGVSGGIKTISKDISPATKATKIRTTQARFSAMKIFYKKHYQKKYPAIVNRCVMRGIDLKLFFAKSSF